MLLNMDSTHAYVILPLLCISGNTVVVRVPESDSTHRATALKAEYLWWQ